MAACSAAEAQTLFAQTIDPELQIGFAVDTDLTQAEFIAPRRMVSWKRRDALLSPSSAIRYKSAALGTNRRGMMLV